MKKTFEDFKNLDEEVIVSLLGKATEYKFTEFTIKSKHEWLELRTIVDEARYKKYINMETIQIDENFNVIRLEYWKADRGSCNQAKISKQVEIFLELQKMGFI